MARCLPRPGVGGAGQSPGPPAWEHRDRGCSQLRMSLGLGHPQNLLGASSPALSTLHTGPGHTPPSPGSFSPASSGGDRLVVDTRVPITRDLPNQDFSFSFFDSPAFTPLTPVNPLPEAAPGAHSRLCGYVHGPAVHTVPPTATLSVATSSTLSHPRPHRPTHGHSVHEHTVHTVPSTTRRPRPHQPRLPCWHPPCRPPCAELEPGCPSGSSVRIRHHLSLQGKRRAGGGWSAWEESCRAPSPSSRWPFPSTPQVASVFPKPRPVGGPPHSCDPWISSRAPLAPAAGDTVTEASWEFLVGAGLLFPGEGACWGCSPSPWPRAPPKPWIRPCAP